MPDSTCSIAGCAKPVHNKANGWCEMHYYRHYRYGDVNGGGAQTRHRNLGIRDQFDTYIKIIETGCHVWQGGLLKSGYGCFRSRPAHRWIWAYINGAIPDGLVVRHKCDNPPCVNVDHMELGTVRQNQDDMVSRGRSLKGSKNAIAKLDEEKVREIRIAVRDKASTQLDLARKYGVTPPCINAIIVGRSWKHVTLDEVA